MAKIAFALTLSDSAAQGRSFGILDSAWITVASVCEGSTSVRFTLPLAGMPETALILGEVYRRAEEWKFRAVGQGFAGGLGPLALYYGVNVQE